MPKSINLLLCLAFAVFLSCNSSSQDPLYLEVMEVHDEVMPKMKDIYKLKRQLKKIPDYESNDALTRQIEKLEEADDAMMDWMAQFKPPKTKDDAYTRYLQSEKEKISEVRDKMLTEIAESQKLVEEYEGK